MNDFKYSLASTPSFRHWNRLTQVIFLFSFKLFYFSLGIHTFNKRKMLSHDLQVERVSECRNNRISNLFHFICLRDESNFFQFDVKRRGSLSERKKSIKLNWYYKSWWILIPFLSAENKNIQERWIASLNEWSFSTPIPHTLSLFFSHCVTSDTINKYLQTFAHCFTLSTQQTWRSLSKISSSKWN